MDEDVKAMDAPAIHRIDWFNVAEDSVWFSTESGILAYSKDSDTWRHYTTKDGLPDNRSRSLLVDGDDVWIGLRDGRFCRYRVETETWETHTATTKDLANKWHETRFAANSRYVWIPAQYEGVLRYDKKTDSWKRYTTADGLATIGHIVADEDDVWAYGWEMCQYDAKTDHWIIIDSKRGLVETGIRELILGLDYLWVLYQGWRNWDEDPANVPASGFHRKNRTWQIFRGHPETVGNNFQDVQETASGVWFGAAAHGVSRYDKASSSWTVFTKEDGVLSNSVNTRTLRVDEDFVWVGSNHGISRYDLKKEIWTVYTGSRALPSDVIRSVAVDSRYIYCGTDQGASRYDKENDIWLTIVHDQTVDYDRVNDLVVDDKYVWITSGRGVRRFDKWAHWIDKYDDKNGLPTAYVKVADVGKRMLWVGTDQGVSKYNTLSEDANAWETFARADEVDTMLLSQEYAESLADNRVTSIAVGKRYVWVGTERGVSRHDLRRGTWVTYTQDDGLLSNEISSICIDGDSVWFGTKGGVSRLNTKTREWSSFTRTNGLTINQVTQIVAADDDVWFGTFDDGLLRYNKKTEQWKHFTRVDGLSHNRVFDLATDEDFLWIGTARGLSRYDTLTDTWTVFTQHFDEEEDRQ
jgi:ligand-binding sensor domain-containing protein